MTYSRPAGTEAFKKCPMTGCFISVWGPLWSDNYCREHGGTPMFEQNDDPFGLPNDDRGADLLHRPATRPLEA